MFNLVGGGQMKRILVESGRRVPVLAKNQGSLLWPHLPFYLRRV